VPRVEQNGKAMATRTLDLYRRMEVAIGSRADLRYFRTLRTGDDTLALIIEMHERY
jgi:hypothetical protein